MKPNSPSAWIRRLSGPECMLAGLVVLAGIGLLVAAFVPLLVSPDAALAGPEPECGTGLPPCGLCYACVNGVCVPVDCPDGPCTIGQCDPQTGDCEEIPFGPDCDEDDDLVPDACDPDDDDDGILDDGDGSSVIGDHPCTGGQTTNCDDNCLCGHNENQTDCNGNGVGDACETLLTRYVDADAQGTGTGDTWVNAYVYLQDALYEAATNPGTIGEIWVAEGTYKPDEGAHVTPDDREAAFQLLNDVALYGGFAGGETQRADRNPGVHPTILSGAIGQQSSYHVVTSDDVYEMGVLDGFAVRDGNADGNPAGGDPANSDRGGGLLIEGGSPTIANCTFTGNSAVQGGAIANIGGAPTLVSCILRDNLATAGGGGLFSDATAQGEALALVNSEIAYNTASLSGGGVHTDNADVTVTNCTVAFNTASDGASGVGGGIHVVGTANDTTITNCIVWGNDDDVSSGAARQITVGSHITVSYSCVEDGAGGPWWAGEQVTGLDPRFNFAQGSGLNLHHNSPCIDFGDGTALPADTVDLDCDCDRQETLPLALGGATRVAGDDVDAGGREAVDNPCPNSCGSCNVPGVSCSWPNSACCDGACQQGPCCEGAACEWGEQCCPGEQHCCDDSEVCCGGATPCCPSGQVCCQDADGNYECLVPAAVPPGAAYDTGIDNFGTEFILTLPRNPIRAWDDLCGIVELHLSGYECTTVHIRYPVTGLLWDFYPFEAHVAVIPGDVTVVRLPESASFDWEFDGSVTDDNAVLATADKEFACVMVNRAYETSDAAMALPTEAWGTEYIVTSYHTYPLGIHQDFSSMFTVVASDEDGTLLTPVFVKQTTDLCRFTCT